MAKEKNETIVALLVKQTALPKKANIIRLAGSGNARPSAIAGPFSKPPLNWSTPPPVTLNRLLPPDEAVVICTYDALCAMIFTDKNPLADLLAQQWLWGGSPDQPNIIVGPGMTAATETDLYCSIPIAPARAFHGPRLYARKFKQKYYMWCDAGSAPNAGNDILVSTGPVAMAATDAVIISIYRLNEGDEVLVSTQRIPGPAAINIVIVTQTLPTADYYRVTLTGDDENTTAELQFDVRNTSSSEIMVHLALADLTERMMSLVQGIRVFGSALHIMNLVSDQNATGSWVGDQPESTVIWTAYLRGATGQNGFQKLASQQGNELMELKKYNPYAFVTPEDSDDWKFHHPFTFNATNGVTNVVNQEMQEFPYVIVYLKSGGVAAGPDASRNVQLEFFQCVEYTSDGIWPMMGVSPASVDDTDAAVKVLSSMENIGHNPAFGDIMRTIGKYVRLSAPVLALLGPYGKAASIAAAGIGAGLGALGYRTKKTARQDPDEEGNRRDKSQRIEVEEMAHYVGLLGIPYVEEV